MTKAVLILSGGLDSTTLLYDLYSRDFDIKAVSINYGQKHKKELRYAEQNCQALGIEHKIINASCLNQVANSSLTRKDQNIPEGHYTADNMKSTVVPNRNMVLLSLAASYAASKGIKQVFYGAHSGDHAIYPDCRPEFVKAMNKAFAVCDWTRLELVAPYLKKNKAQVLQIGLKLGVDYSKTWTCYKGQRLACGKCGSCTERLEAFKLNSSKDPLRYQ